MTLHNVCMDRSSCGPKAANTIIFLLTIAIIHILTGIYLFTYNSGDIQTFYLAEERLITLGRLRNKDKNHSSHTHSTDCCLQRWLPLSSRGQSGHRGDSEDWSRLVWRGRQEWSGAPRPGTPHGDPRFPPVSFYYLFLALVYSLSI